jgi:hypothetical protein
VYTLYYIGAITVLQTNLKFLITYIFCFLHLFLWSRDSSVGIATGYRLGDRGVGVRVPVGSKIFSSPYRPDRLWGPPSLLLNGYRGLFPAGKAAGV